MLREYEFTVIANPHMGDEDTKSLFERYEAIIFTGGGEVLKKSDWGSKKLNYPIKKQFRGRYMHYDLVCKSENLKEAERLMKLDDNILRFLTIKLGEDVDITARKIELAKPPVPVEKPQA